MQKCYVVRLRVPHVCISGFALKPTCESDKIHCLPFYMKSNSDSATVEKIYICVSFVERREDDKTVLVRRELLLFVQTASIRRQVPRDYHDGVCASPEYQRTSPSRGIPRDYAGLWI